MPKLNINCHRAYGKRKIQIKRIWNGDFVFELHTRPLPLSSPLFSHFWTYFQLMNVFSIRWAATLWWLKEIRLGNRLVRSSWDSIIMHPWLIPQRTVSSLEIFSSLFVRSEVKMKIVFTNKDLSKAEESGIEVYSEHLQGICWESGGSGSGERERGTMVRTSY